MDVGVRGRTEPASEPASSWLPTPDAAASEPAPHPMSLIDELPSPGKLFGDKARNHPRRPCSTSGAGEAGALSSAAPVLRHEAPAAARKKRRAEAAAPPAKKSKSPATGPGGSKRRPAVSLTPQAALERFAGDEPDIILESANGLGAGHLLRDGAGFVEAYATALNMAEATFVRVLKRAIAEHPDGLGPWWIEAMGDEWHAFGLGEPVESESD